MPSGPGPISDDAIAQIASWAPPAVATFLLTSRTAPEEVVAHVTSCRANTVQLVDSVPDETYAALREACPGVRVVQVVHVEHDGSVAEALRVSELADAVLLDSGRPSAPVKELGGTGRTHDWSLSRDVVRQVDAPVFLAGGLKASNVAEAITSVGPFGLDLCSGVRTEGALDGAKLRAFLEEVRRTDEVIRDTAT
jgi:phosphoribosylanthranilate isomerase